MQGYGRYQYHQNNRHPVDRVLDNFKVDYVHLGPLVLPLLLDDAGSHADYSKADCHHEYYGDPIGGSPGDN